MRRNGNVEDEIQITTLKKKADFSAIWGDDKLADVLLQLVLPKRSGNAGGGKGEAPPLAEGSGSTNAGDDDIVMVSIKLHGAVLASRSPYFLRALTSGFRESTDKTIVLRLKDEEAVRDMKLLLKLAYTASYVEDNGRPLDKPQLLRLLCLADAYEMTDCVVECAVALCPVADYDEAVQICQAIPDPVLSHKGLEPLLKDCGDVIAKALPPASALWTPGIASSELHKGWVLDEKVRKLPALALVATLQSRWCQILDEKFTFTICVWWCLEEAAREKEGSAYIQALFDYLLQSLCFSQMSTDFLAAVVNECAWVRNSRLYPTITKHFLLKCCALAGEKMKHATPRFRMSRRFSAVQQGGGAIFENGRPATLGTCNCGVSVEVVSCSRRRHQSFRHLFAHSPAPS